ncbi:MAG TPA: phosphotransferase [Xanthomonadaceae bacterium]|nr:phosphotransferase [Xanthomonadaceae bacterium]
MIEVPELDAHAAANLIRAQFPDLAAHEVRWLGEGYDCVAFDVDGEWVFRFPKRSDVSDQLMLEMRLLPALASHSPVPLPGYCFHGQPNPPFPRHFGGYRKLAGMPASGVDWCTNGYTHLAPRLAQFLSWLHAFPRGQAARLGVPQQHLASIVDEAKAEALDDFEKVARAAPDQPLQEWQRFLTDAPAKLNGGETRPVMLHGDFAAEHVLYDPDAHSITGVIDWSDAALGDPALDLAGLVHWGGDRLLRAVLADYRGSVDRETLERAHFLAACRGVADMAFGLDAGRPEYVQGGLRALKLAIPTSQGASL